MFGKKTTQTQLFTGNFREKTTLENRNRWEDNIKTSFREKDTKVLTQNYKGQAPNEHGREPPVFTKTANSLST
jgi:hypothetical protein